MGQANQSNPETNVELRLRTMRILWIALLMSIPMYYVFTIVRGPSENVPPNRTLSLALLGVGLMTTLISFLIKHSLLRKAAEQQQVPMVQQAYILSWAITEVPALLGMLDYFVTGNRQYYLLFIIAVCGMLLHFPRRQAVLNAIFKGPGF